jgi:hypothetical protein
MTKGVRAKASEIQADFSLSQIPGLSNADAPLLGIIQSGNLNMETAVTAQGHWIAPCDCKVVGAYMQVTEQLGTGAGTVGAGLITDTDSIVNDYSVATSVTAGTLVDLTSNAAFLGGNLNKGDVVVFQTDGGATTTGRVVMFLVVVAR